MDRDPLDSAPTGNNRTADAEAAGVDSRFLGLALAAGVIVAGALVATRTRAGTRALASEVEVRRTVTVYKPVEQVYQFWRDFENFPSFMEHVESVRVLRSGRSHWVVRAPFGRTVEWEAEITQERPNAVIAWRSLPGSDIENSGSVHFRRAPGDRGTEVTVRLRYAAPGGPLGRLVATMLGQEPEQQLREELRHFKMLIEAGEVATTLGQPSGRRGLHGGLQQWQLGEYSRSGERRLA